MPSKAPPRGPQLKKILSRIGQQIRSRRKLLKVSAIATAEAAGISRMTLNRIEKGEASVTLGAYLNVISVLGLEIDLYEPANPRSKSKRELSDRVRIADYPQLKILSWQLADDSVVSKENALNIYERNWRHLDKASLTKRERDFIKELLLEFGRSHLLV